MLVFPTAVVSLAREWHQSYAELLPLAVGSFIAFGAFAIPAGWLADHWSRYKTMLLFFFGIGGAMILTGFAQSPWQIAAGLTLTGAFAAIYHPVGIAMLVAVPQNMGRALGWNGLWGNLGLASAALITGALVDLVSWRAAFFVPGVACIAAGVGFRVLVPDPGPVKKVARSIGLHVDTRMMARIFAILLIATACGGIIFNSTTISMPKVFDERLRALSETSFGIGALVAGVYTMAAFAQVVMGTLIDRFELRRLMIGIGVVLRNAGRGGFFSRGEPRVPGYEQPAGEVADSLLARFGLAEYRDKNAQVLPGGIRKLLDIALTMVARPRILLLDEPTSGVSAEEKFEIMEMIMKAVRAEGITVLFVEHDMEVVSRFAERVLAFYDGRIIADAPPEVALADAEVKRFVVGGELHRMDEAAGAKDA